MNNVWRGNERAPVEPDARPRWRKKVEAEVVSVLSQGRQLPSHQQAKQPLVDSLLLFMYLWNI